MKDKIETVSDVNNKAVLQDHYKQLETTFSTQAKDDNDISLEVAQRALAIIASIDKIVNIWFFVACWRSIFVYL